MANELTVDELLVRIDATTEGLRRELSRATGAVSQFASSTDRQLGGIERRLSAFGSGLFKGLIGGFAAGAGIGALANVSESFLRVADSATLAKVRLSDALGSTGAAADAYERLYLSAQRSATSFDASIDLFTNLTRSTRSLGVESERVVAVTEGIQQVVRLAGVSAQSASAGLYQFGQAMRSGKFAGDEFKSVMENLTPLAEEIAAGLGVSLGGLRDRLKDLNESGGATEAIFKALETRLGPIREKSSAIPETLSSSLTKLGNAMTKFSDEMNTATSSTGNVAAGINAITSAIDRLRPAFVGLANDINRGFAIMARGVDLARTALNDLGRAGGLELGIAPAGRHAGFAGSPEIGGRRPAFVTGGSIEDTIAADAERRRRARTGFEGSPELGTRDFNLDRATLLFDREKAKEDEKKRRKAGVKEETALQRELTQIYESSRTPLQKFNDEMARLNDLRDKGRLSADVYTQAVERAQVELDKATGVTKAHADAVADGKRVFQDTRTPAEEYAATITRLNELMAAGTITGDTYARAVEKAKKTMEDAADDSGGLTDAVKELGLTFSSAFEDAVLGGEKLRKVLAGLLTDVARLVLRKGATEPLLGLLGGATKGLDFGSIFSGIGSFFGFADGGVMTGRGPLPLRRYGGGGIASGAQIAMFAEAGHAEAFVPLPNSRRIPVEMRGGGGIVVNNHFHAGVTRAELASVLPQIKRDTIAAVAEAAQRGGSYARAIGSA